MASDVFIMILFWNEVMFMTEKFIFWFVSSSLAKVQITRTIEPMSCSLKRLSSQFEILITALIPQMGSRSQHSADYIVL